MIDGGRAADRTAQLVRVTPHHSNGVVGPA